MARPTAPDVYEDAHRRERRHLNRVRPVVWGLPSPEDQMRAALHMGIPVAELDADSQAWDLFDAEVARLVEQAWALWLLLAVLHTAHDETTPLPTDADAEVAPLVDQLITTLVAAPAAPPRSLVALLAA